MNRPLAPLAALASLLAFAAPCKGEPTINYGSGDASYSIPLFNVAMTPLPLSFSLYYHSQDPLRTNLSYRPMGPGWTHTFNQTLLPIDPQESTLYYLSPEGWE